MENNLFLFVAFLCGVTFNVFWGYILGLGFGIEAFKRSMVDSLIVFTKNIQAVHRIQQAKHMHYELLERDEKYIEYQKFIDEQELNSIKETIIRNYINSIPPRYNNLVLFHDWGSAMEFLSKAIKEKNND